MLLYFSYVDSLISLNNFSLIFLLFAIFFAGFVDSIAGGGGLISIPAYMISGIPGHFVLGTNKFSSTFGTLFATLKFAQKGKILLKLGIVSLISAFIGSILGSNLVLLISTNFIKYLLIILLPIISLIIFFKKDNNIDQNSNNKFKNLNNNRYNFLFYIKAIIFTFIIGIYDGFFGPGTGTFIIMVYNYILKIDMVHASGTAKIVNLGSNVSALITFIIKEVVFFKIGILCTIAGILGNILGSSLAIKKGKKIINPIFLFVLSLLFLKILIDIIKN